MKTDSSTSFSSSHFAQILVWKWKQRWMFYLEIESNESNKWTQWMKIKGNVLPWNWNLLKQWMKAMNESKEWKQRIKQWMKTKPNVLPCSKDLRLPPLWYWLLEVSAFAIVVHKSSENKKRNQFSDLRFDWKLSNSLQLKNPVQVLFYPIGFVGETRPGLLGVKGSFNVV